MAFDSSDYGLAWPRSLFVEEATRLLGRAGTATNHRSWDDDVVWFLVDAFASDTPSNDFQAVADRGMGAPGGSTTWLERLIREAPSLPEPGERTPYWSQRRGAPVSASPLNIVTVKQKFIETVEPFDRNGYLEDRLPEGCPDDQDRVVVNRGAELDIIIGKGSLWPLRGSQATWSEDDLCDFIEVFHDLVSRPTSRSWHSFFGHWHWGGFNVAIARKLYRWRINQLLAKSELNLRLADDGEDLGRLVRTAPSELDALVHNALEQTEATALSDVQHAVALFRSRGAGVPERRSAVVALAGVLESRRKLLEVALVSKDEGALFQIANGFAIRHQRADQRTDYDPAFLDWLFYWYLATIQLTTELAARE